MKNGFLALCVILTLTSCSLFRSLSSDDKPVAVNNPPPTNEKGETHDVPKRRVLVLKVFNLSAYGGEELANKAYVDARNTILSMEDTVAVKEEEVADPDAFFSQNQTLDRGKVMTWARAHNVAAVLYGQIEDVQMRESGDEEGLFRARSYAVNATVRFFLFDVATDRQLLGSAASAEATEEHTEFLGERSPQSFETDRSKGAVAKAMDKAFANLPAEMKKISWMGRIAKVDLHRYYINAGVQSGLAVGQLLKVYGEGLSVTDPQTGTFLGVAPGRFKGILKIIEHFGDNGAVAVVHSGAGFKEQDRVEVYSPPQK